MTTNVGMFPQKKRDIYSLTIIYIIIIKYIYIYNIYNTYFQKRKTKNDCNVTKNILQCQNRLKTFINLFLHFQYEKCYHNMKSVTTKTKTNH